jgi:hypothetical protein
MHEKQFFFTIAFCVCALKIGSVNQVDLSLLEFRVLVQAQSVTIICLFGMRQYLVQKIHHGKVGHFFGLVGCFFFVVFLYKILRHTQHLIQVEFLV